MKRKFVVMLTAAAIVVCGIGVYASGIGNAIVSKFSGDKQAAADEYMIAFESENKERENAISEALENAGVQDVLIDGSTENTMDKYSQMLIAMAATISEQTDFNDLLMRYEYLREVHRLSQEQMDYIADLVISGCDMNDVINVAYFWLDTNEDISLIKQIYDLKGEYEGSSYWIENAYDRATGSKNGALSTDDIENYFARGMTPEDITTADKLCRKGVYTIQEILEKRCEGQSFLQIINEVENNELNVAMTLSDNLMTDAAVSVSEELLKSKEISQLTGKTESEVISSIVDGEYNEDTYYEVYNNKMIEIRDRLETAGLIKSETEAE